MDNKSDLFDLKREKEELDQFLSTLTESNTPSSASAKSAPPVKEIRPVEQKATLEEEEWQEFPRPRPLASAPKPEEAFQQPEYREKPAPRAADTIPIKPFTEAEIKPKVKSSFLPDLEANKEEKKKEPAPKVAGIPEAKPEEPAKTLSSFDQMPLEKIIDAKIPPEDEPAVAESKVEKIPPVEPPAPRAIAPESATPGKGKQIGLLLILVVILLAGAFWLYSGQIINSAKSIPGVGYVIRTLTSVEKDINLVNVRQRLVENKKTGKSMRVIEGLAANVSSETVSNIKITAKLQDAGGAELASMESIAGNMIMDEKLENLDAGAIKKVLEAPRGAQDKIRPKGQIPFMIVFANEPPGVFKMSVTPVDFTKN